MGKGQSKIIHSISLNFNKKGSEAKKDPAEVSLMRVRSSSLESVSTVRLGDVKPHPLSQAISCSAEGLQNAASNLTNQCAASDGNVSTTDGDTSIDSMSLSCEGDFPKDRGFTQSLPAAIERKISIGSKDAQPSDTERRDMDCFSDNFITAPQSNQMAVNCVEQDAWSPTITATADSALIRQKGSPAQQESSFQLPAIPDSLLQKLSPEEWSAFINFVCATLGNSLHSSIIDKKLRPSLIKENTLTNQIDSVDRSNDHTPKQVKICERPRGRSTRHGRHSHRRRNRLDFEDFDDVYASGQLQHGDRPLSLPSLHRITSDSQELIQRLQDLNLRRQEVGLEVEQEVLDVEPEERRMRSKSQDDCCCHVNCHHSDQLRNHGERSHKCTHHRSTRKRRPRGHVDVSLDDNCPGLPQNRVTRRSRHHHVYQQPTVCEQCLQERLENSANCSPTVSGHKRRSTKQQHRQIHSATGEVVMADGLDLSPESKSAGEGEREGETQPFMTLEDMQAVTSDFLKGTNDLDESVIQDLKMQFLLGMEEQRKNTATAHTKGGQRKVRIDAIQPCLSRNRPRNKSSIRMAASGKIAPLWSQLAFPTEPRTGQDSPRTDMAVINLDINSTPMCQPLQEQSSNNEKRSHHIHVHHVIHHSQP